MAGQCAVCLRPIAGKDSFALVGTEAVHRACVQLLTSGHAMTKGTQQQQRIIELEGQVRQSHHLVERLKIAEQKMSNLERQFASMGAVNDQYARDLADGMRREAEYRTQREQARRERDEAVAAREAAKRELALHQQISGRQTPPVQEGSAQPADDGKDATEKRFSLLELD